MPSRHPERVRLGLEAHRRVVVAEALLGDRAHEQRPRSLGALRVGVRRDGRAEPLLERADVLPVAEQLTELDETCDRVPPLPATYTAQERDESIRAYRDQVREWMGADAHALVDVRSPGEFAGELIAPPGYEQEGAQRGGHIPTAESIPWATAVRDDGTFRPADELRELYGTRGVTPDKQITAYCRIGERSAHTWFVLRELLGYDSVRNYDGSWTEWGNLVDVPIERGAPVAA